MQVNLLRVKVLGIHMIDIMLNVFQQLDKAGNTALFWAAHGGHIPCMQLLLQSEKIDLNSQVLDLSTIIFYFFI